METSDSLRILETLVDNSAEAVRVALKEFTGSSVSCWLGAVEGKSKIHIDRDMHPVGGMIKKVYIVWNGIKWVTRNLYARKSVEGRGQG